MEALIRSMLHSVRHPSFTTRTTLKCAVYHHQHGVDAIPFKQKEGSADYGYIDTIDDETAAFLKAIGIDDFEPEREERIYIVTFMPIENWPVV